MIAGGGTGGHAIPALCVADSLSALGAHVEFVGSETGIERELVPKAGYPLHTLPLSGLAGGPLSRARAGALFLKAIARCRTILKSLRPDAVLGVGGYASAPAVFAANTLKIPTFLHEQNSVPGRVNRVASRFTKEALVTFPEAQSHLKDAAWVGMPTRKAFSEVSKDEALDRLGLDPPVVLIFGGSGGALKINLSAAEAFRDSTPYTVVQVSGRRDYPHLSTSNNNHIILEYVENIWDYLAVAEVVVIRAGAGSLFDTAASGRAAIVVPFPYATGDHQLHNARYFTERGAAELMLDSEVTAASIRGRIERLFEDDVRREELARRISTLATPGAADEVAGRLVGVAEKEAGP